MNLSTEYKARDKISDVKGQARFFRKLDSPLD